MPEWKKFFKDKRVTLMGLGLLGRGVGDAIFLAKAGVKLTVTDLKNEIDLAPSLKLLKKFKNISYVLGRHDTENFRNVDLVMKAAGVPLDSQFILEAQKNDVPIIMSTAFFVEYTEAQVIGVTGTRGKSTVSYLLYEILKEHKKKTGQVFLGGNVLGVSTIDLLSETKGSDTAVLELDSWQLQGFAGSHNKEFPKNPDGFSPPVAVFTTFMLDHMNYYQNDLKRYFDDKANIYRFQNPEDILVISEQVMKYIAQFGPEPKSKVIIAKVSDVPESWSIKIPGEHNKLNVALALKTAQALGVPEKTIQKVVESFKPVPGRLELVRIYKGIQIYNDTNATTQDATLAGLEAFGKDKKTILIFGGADKKLETNQLLKVMPKYIKAAIVLPGTGTDTITGKLTEMSKHVPVEFVQDMAEAVTKAFAHAEKGDRILMSPAFASFGIFKNEYDRGDKFNEAVKNL